ncbi:hypothetical protein [Sphingomonas paeninsulae]|jgi:hypothetical protein|nr:hypothetical protein [Sphingomonas paeninsulae]
MTDPENPAAPDLDRVEFDRRRKSRSIVTGVILVGVVILFYFITIARLS